MGSHSESELRWQRKVDVSNHGYIGLRDGAITFGYGDNTEHMRMDSSGNVGIGTGSPDEALYVLGDIKLATTASSGVGVLQFGNNSDKVKIAGFDNSNATPNVMTFYTNNNERMRIAAGGSIGIGTSSPASKLEVNGAITCGGNGISYPTVASNFSRGQNKVAFTWTAPNLYGAVDNVVQIIVGTTSDYRLKANDQALTDGLNTVLALRPITYNPVEFDGLIDESRQELGLIAHEVQAIRPSVVTGQKDAVGEDGKPRYQSVNYAGLVPDLIKAIQEQQATISSLEARITALEAN